MTNKFQISKSKNPIYTLLFLGLFLLPQGGQFYAGDSFVSEIYLDTEGQEINAVEANLSFPENLLAVVSTEIGGSVLKLWIQEPTVKGSIISLTGGIPNGFQGQGLIAKIIFKAKQSGQAKIKFLDSSRVLLNDGQGTPIKINFLEANYEFINKPPGLPELDCQVYGNNLEIHWQKKEGAEYSYLLSQDSSMEPDQELKRIIGDIKYEQLEDGIYYFSLRENKGPKTSCRVLVDITPPEPFEAKIGRDSSIYDNRYFIAFSTTDKTSGIDYYEIKEGKLDFQKAVSPYLLQDQKLSSKIIIRAFDKAGNVQESKIIPQKKISWLWIILGLLIILFSVIIIKWARRA